MEPEPDLIHACAAKFISHIACHANKKAACLMQAAFCYRLLCNFCLHATLQESHEEDQAASN